MTAPSRPVALPESNNIGEVCAAISKAEDRCAVAEADLEAADTLDPDTAELNRADAEYEAAVRDLAMLENHLEELEDEEGIDEIRDLRRDYFKSVL